MSSINKWLLYLFIGLSIVGIADSTYLTIEHYRGEIPPCSVVSGCETVLTSRYATIGPVPLSLLGIGYYASVYLLASGALIFRNKKLLFAAIAIAGLGFLVSLFLFYLQMSIIKHFCMYCLISAGTSTLLFATGLTILKTQKSEAGTR